MKIRKTLGIVAAAVFLVATLSAGGCAPKSGSTKKANISDWEWVPSVWVVNSFDHGKYRGCYYDQESTGYYCPPGTR